MIVAVTWLYVPAFAAEGRMNAAQRTERTFMKYSHSPPGIPTHRMPSTQATPSLLIGDFRRPEFRDVATTMAAVGRPVVVRDLGEAVKHVASEDVDPDVIVLAQSWPGQFCRNDWDQLRRRVPLARVLGLLGTWCEGETRTGQPWPGMIRTYWHRWLPRWSDEFQRLAASQLPAWGHPETMSDDERTLLGRTSNQQGRGLIGVHSLRFEFADMIRTACHEQGYASAWLDPRRPTFVSGVDAIVWDGNLSELDRLRNLRRRSPHAPIVALIDFLRPHEVDTLNRAGASCVLAKPLMLVDLFQALARQLREAGPERSDALNQPSAA